MTSMWEFVVLWTFFQNVNTQSQVLKAERVGLDNAQICQDISTTTKFVQDGVAYILHAKTGKQDRPTVKHCEVILGPANTDRSLDVTFQSFYILQESCGVRLTIMEGKDSTMKDEKTVLDLNCENSKNKKPPDLGFVTERNAFLKFSVVHNLDHRQYNFNINVTAVQARADGDSSYMSVGVQIGVVIISVVAIVVIGYLIYKTVRVKRSMRAFDSEENNPALNNMSSSNHSHPNAYVPMPSHEQVQQYIRQNPDPEIYYEYNPSQSHLLENGLTESTTPPQLPPPYEEALKMPLSTTPDKQYNIEYANINK